MSKRQELLQMRDDLDKIVRSKRELVRKLVVEEGRRDVLARLLGYEVLPFHQILLDSQIQLKGPWRLFLAPRGAGKSTILTVVDCVYRALLDPSVRILIASRVKEQAKDLLVEIQACFERERFVEVFGDLRGSIWGKGSCNVVRPFERKEPTFMTAGADGPVTGKHFDVIKFDDLVDEKNSRTEGERQRIHTFVYKTCLPTLMKVRDDGTPGEADFVGTRYAPEDLYGHLMDNEAKVRGNVCEVPALVDPETGEADVKGESIVPEYLPTEELKNDRISMGAAHFDSQYQQDVKRMQGEIFRDSYFRHYTHDPHILVREKQLKVWAAIDLAVAKHEEHDQYAEAVVGVDDRHGPAALEVYVLDYFRDRISYTAQLERAKLLYEKWQPIRIGVEANAFQATRIDAIYKEHGEEIGDRCVPIITLSDKVTRGWKLAARYEAGRIYHPADGLAEDLEDVLVGFPKRKLKDLFDALDMAVQLGCVTRARRKRDREPGVVGGPRRHKAKRGSRLTMRIGGMR